MTGPTQGSKRELRTHTDLVRPRISTGMTLAMLPLAMVIGTGLGIIQGDYWRQQIEQNRLLGKLNTCLWKSTVRSTQSNG